MENALISICIPTYNGEKYLQEALDSVTKQTYKNIEVIISDDASADATLEIAENFKQQAPFPISIFKHEPAGIGANWDHCIEKATGEWIKFLFQDDILEPNCLEEFLKLQQETGENVFYCKRTIIDQFGENISARSVIADLQKGILPPFDRYFIFKKSNLKRSVYHKPYDLGHNIFGEPVASFVHRSVYQWTGAHSSALKQLVDFEYSLRILRRYPIVISNQKLIKFRVHGEQATQQNWKQNVREYTVLEDFMMRNFFFYLSRTQVLSYLYQKNRVLRYIRGKMPF